MRIWLAAATAVLVACAPAPVALASGHHHRPAALASGTSHGWMQNGWTVHKLNQSYPATASYFFNRAGSYETGTVYDGFAATPVTRYTSEAQFASDVANGLIPAGVMASYDNENWNLTPQAEIDDPWTYMADFISLAHSNGDQVTVTPARDLGNDSTSVHPKLAGETLDQWYQRTDIAGTAGLADIYVVQDQVDTASVTAYDALFNAAQTRAVAVNPGVKVYTELSDNYGTAAQEYTAGSSVAFDGVFLNFANSDVSSEDTLLTSFENGGY